MRFAAVPVVLALILPPGAALAQEAPPPSLAHSAACSVSEDHLRAWVSIARYPQPRELDRYLGGIGGDEAQFEPDGRAKLCAAVADLCRDVNVATAWGEAWLAQHPERRTEAGRVADVRLATTVFGDFRRSWQPPSFDIAEEQLREAYADRPERWKRQDVFTIRHLLVPKPSHFPDADSDGIVATVRQHLAAGEKLETLATEFSAASSAGRGGLVESVEFGKIPAGLNEAVAATPREEYGKVREAEVDYAHFFYEVIDRTAVPDVTFEAARPDLEMDAKGRHLRESGEARIAELVAEAGITVADDCSTPDAVLLATPGRTWTCAEFEAWTEGSRGMASVAGFAQSYAAGQAIMHGWDDGKAAAWRSVALDFYATRLAEADLRKTSDPDEDAVRAYYEAHRAEDGFQTRPSWRIARVGISVALDEAALKDAPRTVLGDYYHLRHGLDAEAQRLHDALAPLPMAERKAFIDTYVPSDGFRIVFTEPAPSARIPDEIAPLVDQLAAGELTPVRPYGDSERSILWWSERIDPRPMSFEESKTAARDACIDQMAKALVADTRAKFASDAPLEWNADFFPDGPCPSE